MTADGGSLRFARYAYPPNELGYCGPGAHVELLERVTAGAGGPGLDRLAQQFDGAWPYLTLVAGRTDRSPLEDEVVRAYWLGSELVHSVAGHDVVRSLDDRFRDRSDIDAIVDPVRHGAVPHHSLHVLAVYPWAGLLRAGRTEPSLQVMERCLVRWGRVLSTDEATAEVEVVTLAWHGGRLFLGPTRLERFQHALSGLRLVEVQVGDDVAVHWSWICDVLSPAARRHLEHTTRHNIDAVNLAHPVQDVVD